MQFVFKRDEEGREKVYYNGRVLVAEVVMRPNFGRDVKMNGDTIGVTTNTIWDAIERADEAGFWEKMIATEPMNDPGGAQWWKMSVTVDVPVADNATLSVTTEEDES